MKTAIKQVAEFNGTVAPKNVNSTFAVHIKEAGILLHFILFLKSDK